MGTPSCFQPVSREGGGGGLLACVSTEMADFLGVSDFYLRTFFEALSQYTGS